MCIISQECLSAIKYFDKVLKWFIERIGLWRNHLSSPWHLRDRIKTDWLVRRYRPKQPKTFSMI